MDVNDAIYFQNCELLRSYEEVQKFYDLIVRFYKHETPKRTNIMQIPRETVRCVFSHQWYQVWRRNAYVLWSH